MSPRWGARIFLVGATCASVSYGSVVSPVAKVIQMLTDMKATGAKELENERMVFDGYTKFANSRRSDLEYEIQTGTTKGEQLTATIAKADSDVQVYITKLADLDKEVASLEASRKEAIEMRESDSANYQAEQTDYTETLYALDRAIQVLKSQNYDREQAMMMLQKTAKTPQEAKGMRRVLAALALLQTEQPDGAPAVAAYEFQSSSIVETLEQLQKKFTDELGELEKAEMNSAHAHNMVLQHTGSVLASLKTERDQRLTAKATAEKTGAAAKGELNDVEALLADAKKALLELNVTFDSKKITFEANQQVRAEEIEALAKAVEILQTPEAADAYANRIKVLLQTPARKSASFLQLGARSRLAEKQNNAQNFLKKRAEELHSKALKALVGRMADSPFSKVIDMVESLIDRLKEQAASEADHKAYCDEELKKSKQKRDELTASIDRLRAEADEKAVAVSDMASDITQLAAEQAELHKALAEATNTRSEEKEENAATIKDAKAGQIALKQAIAVLAEFYQAQGASFVQSKQVPEMAVYRGMQGKQGGVVGMLEVIESDFARLQADTEAAEAQAASEYEQFSSESEKTLKLKHDAEFKLSLEKDQTDFEREQLEKDFAATTNELDAAKAYYDELKPQCVSVNVSHEERAARRQEEVESLQQAYKILNGDTSM